MPLSFHSLQDTATTLRSPIAISILFPFPFDSIPAPLPVYTFLASYVLLRVQLMLYDVCSLMCHLSYSFLFYLFHGLDSAIVVLSYAVLSRKRLCYIYGHGFANVIICFSFFLFFFFFYRLFISSLVSPFFHLISLSSYQLSPIFINFTKSFSLVA